MGRVTTPFASTSLERMPQLDGLRAFAVVGVAVSHWTPNFLVGIVPWGTGVQLFFVLSGFLITEILLRSRPDVSGASLRHALRTFYIRRALRIFPLYYAVLVISLLLDVGSVRETWRWHVAYLSNFHYAWHGHGPATADPFLHLWSLSVEEQFYLGWPLAVLLLSRRFIPVVLCLTIVISVAFRTVIEEVVPGIVSVRYLTPSCLDAFAVGAFVAYVRYYKGREAVPRLGWIFAGVGIAGLVVCTILLPRLIGHVASHRIGHTFLVIFYGAIVAGASTGFSGLLGRTLSFRPLVYLGAISYGVYVFHYFAPLALQWVTARLGVQEASSVVLVFGYVVFTLVLSVVSWHGFEHPLNRLKRWFPYPAAREPVPRQAATEPGWVTRTP